MSSAIQAIREVSEATDPKQAILDRVSKAVAKIDVMYNMVLLGTYARPAKTAGGVWRPETNVQEDMWQGKVGLVLKMGASAFKDDAEFSFEGSRATVGDWVVYKVGDAWSITISDYPCRLVKDSAIRLKVIDPQVIF